MLLAILRKNLNWNAITLIFTLSLLQPELLKVNIEIETHLFLLLLELFESLCGPSQGAGLRYMVMVPSTRNKKLQRKAINCKCSLWTRVCACPGSVADVTDPFDHDSSETLGNHWQSNICPTPLKSPKSRTNSAYCVHFQNKRFRGLCHGCKRCPRPCVFSKAWHVQTEDTFLARLYRKRSKLAATCRKCNVCTRQNLREKTYKRLPSFTPSYTGWKTFGGTSLRQPKSKKY